MRVKPLIHSDMTEALLAQIVQVYYTQLGYELYPEVVLNWFSGRPDFVGVKDSLVMSVECKKTLSYEVIEQLFRWRHVYDNYDYDHLKDIKGIPHLLIAASFRSKKGQVGDLKAQLLKQNRFGYISVSYEGPDHRNEGAELVVTSCYNDHMRLTINGQEWTVREEIVPKIQAGSRQTAHRISEQLHPDMKRAVAGVSGRVGGNFSTPFRRTLMKAVAVLEKIQPLHIQHIVNAINADHGGHHYSSDAAAKQGIAKFLREFEIAESVNGLPTFQLTPDYKSRLFASETATQRQIKERRVAREEARAQSRQAPAPFWETH